MQAVIYVHLYEDGLNVMCFNEKGVGRGFETIEQARKHCLEPLKVEIETIIHEFDSCYD